MTSAQDPLSRLERNSISVLFLTSILARVIPEHLRWAPCFPPTLITSRCSLSKPNCLAFLCPNQVRAWRSWSKLAAEDLVFGFLGLTCMIFFFTSYKFPETCQRNKIVLSTIKMTRQNISPHFWGIMLFSGPFAFTSTYTPTPPLQFSKSLKIDIQLDFHFWGYGMVTSVKFRVLVFINNLENKQWIIYLAQCLALSLKKSMVNCTFQEFNLSEFCLCSGRLV